MKIAIEARALSAASGGIKTYTHELLHHLIVAHSDVTFELLYGSRSPLGRFSGAKETVIPLQSEVFLPLWMKRVAKHIGETKPNVVHYTKAAIPKKKTAPTVVTIYDIIPILFPETQSPLRRLYWARALEHAAKYSDHILTISECSKNDIIEHFGVGEEKITVTPLAVDLNHFTPLCPLGSAGQAPYILFVGTKDVRKNIGSLIRAFARIAPTIPHQLIIAGRPAKKPDTSKQLVCELQLQDRVEFRESVSYSELPALYSGADIFVWPSIYEGWGFPPQEAMACGTPVIVSDGGPLREVVGDAGVVVPLSGNTFVERLSSEMLSLIQDDPRKKELAMRGVSRVKQFSWKSVGEKTWEVYTKVAL